MGKTDTRVEQKYVPPGDDTYITPMSVNYKSNSRTPESSMKIMDYVFGFVAERELCADCYDVQRATLHHR